MTLAIYSFDEGPAEQRRLYPLFDVDGISIEDEAGYKYKRSSAFDQRSINQKKENSEMTSKMRMNSLIIMLAIVAGLLFSGPVIADEGDDDHMDDHDMMGSWGMTYAAFWMLVLVLAIVVITIGLYKVLADEGQGPMYKAPSTAEVLLDERYARGEIETEEYLRMRHMMGR